MQVKTNIYLLLIIYLLTNILYLNPRIIFYLITKYIAIPIRNYKFAQIKKYLSDVSLVHL